MKCPSASRRAGRRPPDPSPVCARGGHPKFAVLNSCLPRIPGNPSGMRPGQAGCHSGWPAGYTPNCLPHCLAPTEQAGCALYPPVGDRPRLPTRDTGRGRDAVSELCSAPQVPLPPGAERSGARTPPLPAMRLVTVQTVAGGTGRGGRPRGGGGSGEQGGAAVHTPAQVVHRRASSLAGRCHGGCKCPTVTSHEDAVRRPGTMEPVDSPSASAPGGSARRASDCNGALSEARSRGRRFDSSRTVPAPSAASIDKYSVSL